MSKIKMLNDRIFNKLWTTASKVNNKNQYIQMYTSAMSEDYIDFNKKYGIKYEQALDLLSEIYDKQHLSFKDLLILTGKRKADIANTFCIPIRTVEEWYNGKNPCTSYIRLMILRHYKKLNLGKYIYTEAELEYKNNTIPIYNKHKVSDNKKQTSASDTIWEESELTKDDSDDELLEIDAYLKELRAKRERQKNTNIPDSGIKELLQKTDFIGDILTRKNR